MTGRPKEIVFENFSAILSLYRKGRVLAKCVGPDSTTKHALRGHFYKSDDDVVVGIVN